MKTNFFIILLFTITFSCELFLSSCQKDKPCVHGTTELDISSDDFAKVPYKDTSKLTFVRTSTNDTFTFNGLGWVTDYWTFQTQDECYQLYKLQSKYIVFSCIKYPQPITVSFLYYSPSIPYLEIDFTTITSSPPNTYIILPIDIDKPYQYDSLLIQNKFYYKVRYFKNEYKPEYNTAYGCYCTAKDGIIKMETSDGDKWELIKVQ